MSPAQPIAGLLLAGLFLTPWSVQGQIPEDEPPFSLRDFYQDGLVDETYGPRTRESLVVEDAFRNLLGRWAAGESEAPGTFSDLLQQVVENKAGRTVDADSLTETTPIVVKRVQRQWPVKHIVLPGRNCLAKIQDHTLDELEKIDPQALYPLAYFYQRAARSPIGFGWTSARRTASA